MTRQGNTVVPTRGDSSRDLIHKELRRGLGRRSRRSEREGSVPSSSQEGSHLSHSSCSRSVSRSPSSSRHSRSSGRRSHRSHAPSCSSHVLGGSSPPPLPLLRFLVASPAHVSRRATPSATISRVPPLPPPTFVMPLGPASPPYTPCSGSVSRAPPRQLLPLFPSVTPPPRYVLPSPSHGVMGPLPAPRPVSQLTPRLPAPFAGNLAALSLVSLRPSTACPSTWVGCRPRL